MSGIEPDDPFSSFFEVVKVGRDWHWFPDVTIYYISQTRSKCVKLFSASFESYSIEFSC